MSSKKYSSLVRQILSLRAWGYTHREIRQELDLPVRVTRVLNSRFGRAVLGKRGQHSI